MYAKFSVLCTVAVATLASLATTAPVAKADLAPRGTPAEARPAHANPEPVLDPDLGPVLVRNAMNANPEPVLRM